MIVVLCLLLWALPMCAAAEDLVLAGLDDAAGSSSSSGAGTSAETESGVPTIWDAVPVTTDVSGDWRMILVNRANLLPDGFQVDLAVVPYVNDPNTLFDARAVDELNQMLLDCAAQGYYPIVRAAYRSRDTQSYLYENKIQEWQADGYSREEAEAVASTIVAIPGSSEHQLGLACDIADTYGTLNSSQADSPMQQWLMANCTNYGFILRFPDGKSDITGIIYEPWHYRYVGKEMAAKITESGLCLEEYLEQNPQQG